MFRRGSNFPPRHCIVRCPFLQRFDFYPELLRGTITESLQKLLLFVYEMQSAPFGTRGMVVASHATNVGTSLRLLPRRGATPTEISVRTSRSSSKSLGIRFRGTTNGAGRWHGS